MGDNVWIFVMTPIYGAISTAKYMESMNIWRYYMGNWEIYGCSSTLQSQAGVDFIVDSGASINMSGQ